MATVIEKILTEEDIDLCAALGLSSLKLSVELRADFCANAIKLLYKPEKQLLALAACFMYANDSNRKYIESTTKKEKIDDIYSHLDELAKDLSHLL